ncbi:MAG: ATP-dependent RecD-like DNA helicase [Erysipelotrichaceae bacterium]|nr:ATP-dependent RecD-like DNA helicase [Erysipelotrichaceae bacterium]
MESIDAILDTIIYENEQNHYAVALFSETKTYHTFTAAGTIRDVQEDIEYNLTGQYIVHPKYGMQFQIQTAIKKLPTNEKQIIRFLCSDKFSGIGKKTATDIYQTLGDNCLEQISKDASILNQVSSLNATKRKIIQEGIQEFSSFNESYIQLMKYGLSDHKIELLEKQYENPLEVIEKNCFQPFYEVNGFGYKTSVQIANMLQMQAMDTRRQDAYICNLCRELVMSYGNTYITFENIFENVKVLSEEQVKNCLIRLIDDGYLQNEKNKYYPFQLLSDEIVVSKGIKDHIFKVEPVEEEILKIKLREVEFSLNIEYDTKQVDAVSSFFNHSISIINGGPGTGKTTIVRGILRLCKQIFPQSTIQLCAPTGRASKRLTQLSDCDSRTIHSLLQWDLHSNTFGKDEKNKIECDFLIVDEFSMVDTHLFAQLMKALPLHCRILLIGDENQLESVGPGKVFEDLIDSEILPVVHLNRIYRQEHGSGIVTLAKEIREEGLCRFEDGVTFIEKNNNEILEEIKRIASQQEVQILAPMYKGSCGIDAINQMIQQLKNPKAAYKKELKVGTITFRERDKVMLLKNMADEDVYNGDIGTIVHIEKTKEMNIIEVDFGNNVVCFDHDFLYYLTHAYCISIHKSQGSEYDNVVFICDAQSIYMLEKRLIYTAISRAKHHLYIIGNANVFKRQVRMIQKRIRQTSLKERLGEIYD